MSRWLVTAAGLVVMGAVLTNRQILGRASEPLTAPCATRRLTLPDGATMTVEVATTPESRARGLAGRRHLAAETGMLFVFPVRGVYPFWMKGTLVPLDIVWLDNNQVVDRATLAAEGATTPSYTPRAAAAVVLELAAGEADRHGVMINAGVAIPTCQSK